MKAIVVKQPFATFIKGGVKWIETRRWPTSHRGELLIVAGKSIHKGSCLLFGEDQMCKEVMEEWQLDGDDVPIGKAICIVNVLDCRPMTKEDEPGACCRLYEGAWAWELEVVQSVKPFDVRGQLRFFEVEDSLVVAHRHQYGCDCEVQECRICGCTDYDCQDCIERTGDACTWAEEDLCSACVDLKCRDCGKPADGIFHLSSDEAETESGLEHIPLCYSCSKNSFCPGCHQFYAGTNEFDRNGGWCDNCKSEIDN